jgi:integrase
MLRARASQRLGGRGSTEVTEGRSTILSTDQLPRLLEAARGDHLGTLYVLAVHCGLRQGELLGLRWEDVDLEAGTLHVRRALALAKMARSLRPLRLLRAADRDKSHH